MFNPLRAQLFVEEVAHLWNEHLVEDVFQNMQPICGRLLFGAQGLQVLISLSIFKWFLSDVVILPEDHESLQPLRVQPQQFIDLVEAKGWLFGIPFCFDMESGIAEISATVNFPLHLDCLQVENDGKYFHQGMDFLHFRSQTQKHVHDALELAYGSFWIHGTRAFVHLSKLRIVPQW